MVWYGMVWYGMVWYGMVWYGMVWYGMVWYGTVWYGMVRYGMVINRIASYDQGMILRLVKNRLQNSGALTTLIKSRPSVILV